MTADVSTSTNHQQCRAAALLAQKSSTFPISELPLELFGRVLQFSLPTIDPMEWIWEYDECRPYITELYHLRCVSTTWRGAIDNTPFLWMLVSSSWPREVIDTALSRSAAGPLIIHHIPCAFPTIHEAISFSREFIHLVNSHRSRWVAAIFALPMQLLPGFIDTPIPRLDTLKLSVTSTPPSRDDSGVIQCTPALINLLTNLEHVHLNCLPLKWEKVASTFSSLKTLMLSNLRCGITLDLIFQVIRNNPLLENIVIMHIETDVEDSPLWSSDPILLPQLREFRVQGTVLFLENIIGRIQLPPALEVLAILATISQSARRDAALWTKIMLPLVPTIQRLYERRGKSAIFLDNATRCTWTTDAGATGFKLRIDELDPPLALKCIASLIDKLQHTESIPDLKFSAESNRLDADTSAALATIRPLTLIQISIGSRNIDIPEFLELLGGINSDSKDSIPFPFLRYVNLRRWRSDIDGVIQAVKQRYSPGRMEALRPRHRLHIDFTAFREVLFEDPKRPGMIIRMDKIRELRGIDGVERVRLGYSTKRSGMLAVVWSEEESRKVWG